MEFNLPNHKAYSTSPADNQDERVKKVACSGIMWFIGHRNVIVSRIKCVF